MSASNQPRVIFIGNIPFEITEEQLIDIFKEVGPVLSFRLMFDRETGRSRGYAFCEYADSDTAASAIRNLTGYEIGGRHLKVDKADNDMLPSVVGGSILGREQQPSNSGTSGSIPSARPVQNLPGVPASASTAAIHSILSAPPFTNPQSLLELLTSLKGTIQNNPDQARHLLAGNPALSYALLQTFVSLNLIDMSTVQVIFDFIEGAIVFNTLFYFLVLTHPISTSHPATTRSIPSSATSTSSSSEQCRTTKGFDHANHEHDTRTNQPPAATTTRPSPAA